MGPAIPMAIAAGASLLGGLIQNRSNTASAKRQMEFQERMANTSYQRARNDMTLAGYSPYLAYSQGGATSPGGAQATMSDVIGPAVNSAQSARRLKTELETMESTMMSQARDRQTSVDLADKYKQDVKESKAREELTNQQSLNVEQGRIGQSLQNLIMEMQMSGHRNRRNVEDTRFGRWMPYVERLSKTLFGPLIGAAAGRLSIPRFGSSFPGGSLLPIEPGKNDNVW